MEKQRIKYILENSARQWCERHKIDIVNKRKGLL